MEWGRESVDEGGGRGNGEEEMFLWQMEEDMEDEDRCGSKRRPRVSKPHGREDWE